MTAPRNEPGTFQSILDWLEGELRQVKAQVADHAEEVQQARTQVWDVIDQVQRADAGASNMAAQINVLSGLADDVRTLRERLERFQGMLGRDQEQMELISRQLRAEMQAERDERGELRRRTEFSEQAALSAQEKLAGTEEVTRRVGDDLALQQQRSEQFEINMAGIEARIAANAESIRRAHSDGRNTAAEIDRHDRALSDLGERLDRLQETQRSLEENVGRSEEIEAEFEAIREGADSMRQATAEMGERAGAMARDREALEGRLTELERGLERGRTRATQQDRALAELRSALADARDQITRDSERLLSFQEKMRRRQIADLEQEIREIKGQGRQQSHA